MYNIEIVCFIDLQGLDSGQSALGRVAESTYNIDRGDRHRLHSVAGTEDRDGISCLLQSSIPIYLTDVNWPLLTISKGFFECAISNQTKNQMITALVTDDQPSANAGWGNEDDIVVCDNTPIDDGHCGRADTERNSLGWDVEDIELPVDIKLDETIHSQRRCVTVPAKGTSKICSWISNSQFILDHLSAGSYAAAFTSLNGQVGVINFDPYKSIFMSVYACSKLSLTLSLLLPPSCTYPTRSSGEDRDNRGLPAFTMQLSDLVKRLHSGYQLTTSGQFPEAVRRFQEILLHIPLLIVNSKQDLAEAHQLINICRNYILALKMETERKENLKLTTVDHKRICEMVAYFTHCDLQPIHQILTLRTAVSTLFKMKNYKTARSFARRLLDLGPRPEVAQQFRKVLQACENNPTDEDVLDYDEKNPFTLCGITFRPIYKGEPEAKCPLCTASYQIQYKNSLCNICQVSEIDKPCGGLKISSQIR
ncbi:hypothetical protein QAD02_012762 [Eretmocerus hayati]|uniref:Uncharacterized protein n=1 Tax=Eretmocerus hayati TaxID=131215 RepID=A0ACC2P0B7_9HYME|nr:hypothetical protein QAD02_012762 [Eretmocerus hayati]